MSFIKTLFGGRTPNEQRQETAYQSAFQPLVQQGAGYAKEYHDLVAPTLGRADAALAPVTDYYGKVAKGGQSMYDALSPELSGEETAYKNVSAASQYAPRGSGQVSRQGQLDTAHLSGIASILAGGRDKAFAGLGSIASLLYNLGLGEASASTGQAGTIGQLLNQNRTTNVDAMQLRQQMLASTLKSIGSAVGSFS